jgi:hypothetical protein
MILTKQCSPNPKPEAAGLRVPETNMAKIGFNWKVVKRETELRFQAKVRVRGMAQ